VKALALVAALVLTPVPASAPLPRVAAQTPQDAFSACYHAYYDVDASVLADCVNSAAAHFYGKGHHTKLWNT
jgi:hypothetical protein